MPLTITRHRNGTNKRESVEKKGDFRSSETGGNENTIR